VVSDILFSERRRCKVHCCPCGLARDQTSGGRYQLNDFVVSRRATAGSDCHACADDERRRLSLIYVYWVCPSPAKWWLLMS